MRFHRYRLDHCIRGQIQSAGLWLQIGSNVWGITRSDWRRSHRGGFKLGLAILAPVECKMTRSILMLEFGRREIGYRSKGEVGRDDPDRRFVGFRLGGRA